MQGSDGKIRQQDTITRAEMAAVVNRAFGAEKLASLSEFFDVPEDAWYYSEIAKAVAMGDEDVYILFKYPEGTRYVTFGYDRERDVITADVVIGEGSWETGYYTATMVICYYGNNASFMSTAATRTVPITFFNRDLEGASVDDLGKKFKVTFMLRDNAVVETQEVSFAGYPSHPEIDYTLDQFKNYKQITWDVYNDGDGVTVGGDAGVARGSYYVCGTLSTTTGAQEDLFIWLEAYPFTRADYTVEDYVAEYILDEADTSRSSRRSSWTSAGRAPYSAHMKSYPDSWEKVSVICPRD